MKLLFKVVCDIEDLADFTLASVGQSGIRAAIISSEENRENYCKSLRGKILFSALYGPYTVTLIKLKAVLESKHQTGQQQMQDNGLQEVRSRKRHTTEEVRYQPHQCPTKTRLQPEISLSSYGRPHWTHMPQYQSPLLEMELSPKSRKIAASSFDILQRTSSSSRNR
jgi:hypothetical protein